MPQSKGITSPILLTEIQRLASVGFLEIEMRLGGWQRIGVIASIVFFAVVFIHQYSQGTDLSAKLANIDLQRCKQQPSATDEQCKLVWQEKFEFYDETHLPGALLTAGLPIPIAWFLAYIIVAVYGWVRRGFTPDHR